MANNYLLFSVELPLGSPEEHVWTKRVLDRRELWCGGGEYSFYYEFDKGSVVLYSEESGNVDDVAQLISRFLRRFHPQSCFVLQWAMTCSRPRPGEFGGGCCVITKDDRIWRTTNEVANEIRRDLGMDRL